MIETKKVFMLRKGKMYLLSRKEREEVYVFIEEKLRKEYIRLSKSSQMASIFFIEKKDGKKHMVFFFFFYQQFITWLAVEDRGSYFHNYVQRKHTDMN